MCNISEQYNKSNKHKQTDTYVEGSLSQK